MLGHAFRFVGSIVFLVRPQNYRSQWAVEKVGGVRDGARPNGFGMDSFLYRITASDFGRVSQGLREYGEGMAATTPSLRLGYV